MQILQAGGHVLLLRFLPDGRLLAVVAGEGGEGAVHIWSLPGGERQHIPLGPRRETTPWPVGAVPGHPRWGGPSALAIHPGGRLFYIAWEDRLLCFRTEDGTPLPVPDLSVRQVILSPDAQHLVTARHEWGSHEISALAVDGNRGRVLWTASPSAWSQLLAGFLPDGERFVTVDPSAVRVRSLASNTELASARFPANSVAHPLLSPDGKYLGVTGYTSMYVYETAAPGRPRRISGSTAFGNFVSFAFHPDGRQLAVIHGGPTLVKMYRLETLKLEAKLSWKLGPLQDVTFSPDGCLGAAGSCDGRIVLWDIDQ